MAEIPAGLRYTEEHEYLRSSDQPDIFVVGITDYAQGELGDVVYLELPSPGDSFKSMDTFGTIEAVKAVSDLFCPVDGEIVEVNPALEDDPSLVNSDPYGEGWMLKIKADDPGAVEALMDADAYKDHIGE